MSLTTIEKLESLGFQFWEKKSSAGSNAKETKAYFIAIKSILFCFSNQTSLDKTFVHIERFMLSVAKALNSKETGKFLDTPPKAELIKKIIYFGESCKKDSLEKEFPDAILISLEPLEHLLSNSQSKQDLWLSIKD
jgi:hypothetical protein